MSAELVHAEQLGAAPAALSAPAALVEWAKAAGAAHQLAAPLCRTDFVPAHFRGKEDAATAAILYGAEAGLSPLQALQGIYVIGGRPALYARTMLAVTLSAGHDVRTMESTDVRAVVEAQRRGSSHVEKVVVTIDQAKRAGWTSNKKYATEPATMLLARAQSQACRRIAPDALLGMAYSAEELQDDEVSAAPVEPKRAARRTRAAVEAAPPTPEPDLEPEPNAAATEDGPAGISDAQLKKLHATLGDLGMTDRDEALALLGQLAGRQLTSSKDLSRADAVHVIDQLEQMTGGTAPQEPPLDDTAWPETRRPPDAEQ